MKSPIGCSQQLLRLSSVVHFRGAENTLKSWSELNGCTREPMAGNAGCKAYSQCKECTEVTLCTKQGGSHDPGEAKQGWEFMKKHPMP